MAHPDVSTAAQPLSVPATITWGVLAYASFFLISWAGVKWLSPGTIADEVVGILAYLSMIAIVALAVGRSGWSFSGYNALTRQKPAHIALGIAAQVVTALIFMAVANALARYNIIGQANPAEVSVSANLAFVAAFWISNVLVGPVAEEVVWRGFLYRGLASSWMGPLNAIFAIAVVFMLLHFAADTTTRAWHLTSGVLFGLLRWYTGALTAPIAAHVFGNGVVAYLQTTGQ